MTIPLHSFQVSEEELFRNLERYVDAFQESLQSHFLVLPKGSGYVAEGRFIQAYKVLELETGTFERFTVDEVLAAVAKDSLAFVVLRTILGLSPPELGQLVGEISDINIEQSTIRRLDKRARDGRPLLSGVSEITTQQVRAIVTVAVQLIVGGLPSLSDATIHRLDKIDTRSGLAGLRQIARRGVRYSSLLYERLLGRPFATHRDAVSELVGHVIEEAVEHVLQEASIRYYKTGVAERFEDMDQAPDYFIPNQQEPTVVIEAKLAEDDGTARDKVTRIQHLAELRDRRERADVPTFELVACIDGRGFGIRRSDIEKLLLATRGELFTLQTMSFLVENTRLKVVRNT